MGNGAAGRSIGAPLSMDRLLLFEGKLRAVWYCIVQTVDDRGSRCLCPDIAFKGHCHDAAGGSTRIGYLSVEKTLLGAATVVCPRGAARITGENPVYCRGDTVCVARFTGSTAGLSTDVSGDP